MDLKIYNGCFFKRSMPFFEGITKFTMTLFKWTSNFRCFLSHFGRSAMLMIHHHVLLFRPLCPRKTSHFKRFLNFIQNCLFKWTSNSTMILFLLKYAHFQTNKLNRQWPFSNGPFTLADFSPILGGSLSLRSTITSSRSDPPFLYDLQL